MRDRVAKRKKATIDGVFDIETEAWDSFVVGGIRSHGETRLFWHDAESDLVSAILSSRGTLYAHNGGRFDALWLLQHLADRDISAQISLAGASVVTIKIDFSSDDKRLTIRDSARLVPMSLDKFSKMFPGTARKGDTDLPCVCTDEKKAFYLVAKGAPSCGGYCSIRRTMASPMRTRLEWYLEQDLVSLEQSLDALELYCERNDLDLGGTIGGSAWSTSLRRCDLLTAADWGKAISALKGGYALARKGYFGGRVSVGRTYAEHLHSYDINSAYPAALRNLALPTGSPRTVDDGSALYRGGREGIVTARVDVPDSYCPPLPLRTPGGRIAYPTGSFTGEWAANELRYAESVGVRVRRVGRSIFWPTAERIFPAFIDDIYRLRRNAIEEHAAVHGGDGKKSPLAQWLKLVANSLTGKFAQHPESEAFATGSEHISKLFCARPSPCFGELCRGERCCVHVCKSTCGKWEMYGTGGRFFCKPLLSFSASSHVQYAAYLTAATRTTLHAEMHDDFVYSDTDCVKRLRPDTRNIGPELGQWQYEGEYKGWQCIAPKVYGNTKVGGKFQARGKGIPDATANWEAIVTGEDIELPGVMGLKTALRSKRGVFVRRDDTRHVTQNTEWIGDRKRIGSGNTRPPTFDEAVARK
jgi:hypothetical protein